MEENNGQEKSAIEKGANTVKNAGKKKIVGWMAPLISGIAAFAGIFFLALLAVGLTMVIQKLIQDTILSIFDFGNDTSSITTITNTEIENLIEIDENSGAYKLVEENIAKQIREKLEDQKVNNELLGFELETESQTNEEEKTDQEILEEIEDMIDTYIDAEVKTTYPKTDVDLSLFTDNIDGIITVRRASVSTEKIEPLKYKKYKEFCKLTNSDDILTWFSINPEDFSLCIAREANDGDDTTAKYFIEEIDYQKYTQSYSTPLNFFIALHLVSQDVDFMKDFVDLVLENEDKNPIELTYVEKVLISTTEYDYSGYAEVEVEPEEEEQSTDEDSDAYVPTSRKAVINTQDSGGGDIAVKTIPINNDNVNEIGHYDAKASKSISYTTGELYVTNADTWLDVCTTELSDKAVPEQIGQPKIGEPNVVKDEDGIYIEETITTSKSKVSFTVTEVETEDKAEYVQEFVDLIKKYPNVENNITTAPSDLFYLLQQDEKTQKHERIMRYVLYQLTDINYGILDEDLDYLLTVEDDKYEEDEYLSSSQLLKEYIRAWENYNPPTSADGTCYIIQADPVGRAGVGYGIDIESSGYKQLFIDNGYPTEIGGEVPIEFVDAIEEEIMKFMLQYVKDATSGLDLTPYQINALVSRSYNCGTGGALDTYRGTPSLNFVESYEEYWNQETDDQYEERNNEADFNHELYTQYMSKPVTADGVYLSGLETRRKSEWTLFQTGYYDVISKWHNAGDNIVMIADKIHQYMEAHEYTYCVLGSNNGDEYEKHEKGCGLNNTFEESKTGYKNTCCATYVYWVLQEAGYITKEDIKELGVSPHSAAGMSYCLNAKGWTKIMDPDELQPGDILFYYRDGLNIGHTDIYAGDGTKYNAGAGSIIRAENGYSSPQKFNENEVDFAYRAPDNSILTVADKIHKYMEAHDYTYCANNGSDECGDPKWSKSHEGSGKYLRTFEGSKKVEKSACAYYVSWVLQDAGIMKESEISVSVGGIEGFLQEAGWEYVTDPDKIKPGDILIYNGRQHIDIYAGNKTKYNAGSGSAIRGSSPQKITNWDEFCLEFARAYRQP